MIVRVSPRGSDELKITADVEVVVEGRQNPYVELVGFNPSTGFKEVLLSVAEDGELCFKLLSVFHGPTQTIIVNSEGIRLSGGVTRDIKFP